MAVKCMKVVATNVDRRLFTLDGINGQVRIGNNPSSDVRFVQDYEGQTLEAEFSFVGDAWILRVITGLRIRTNTKGKIPFCEVLPGVKLELRTEFDDRTIAALSFFAQEKPTKDFSLRIYLPVNQNESVLIGGMRECNIQLPDQRLHNLMVRLVRQNHTWVFCAETTPEATVNEQSMMKEIKLEDGTFIGVGRFRFYFKQGCLYTTAEENLRIIGLTNEIESEQASALKYPVYMRSTRLHPKISPSEIEILPPQKFEESSNRNVLLQIIPQIGALAMIIVLRGIIGGGGTYVIYSAATMALGIGVSIFSRRDGRKRRMEKENRRRAKYLEYVKQKIEEITAARQTEGMLMHRIFRPYEENIETVRNFDKRLFDRSPYDDDFMNVRLGTGSLPATTEIKINKQEYKDIEDDLMDIPESIEKNYKYLAKVPIVSSFSTIGAIGVVGDAACRYEVFKNITLDLCIRQYYKEIRFYYIFDESDLAQYGWTRWLHNCSSEDGTLRNLIYDDESAKVHLELIYKELAAREEYAEESAAEAEKLHLPFYVVFVCDCERIRNHPISQFFEKSSQLGCAFIFFNQYEELIPKGCTQLIRLDTTGNTGNLVVCSNDAIINRFQYPSIPDSIIEEMVWKLCAVSVVEANLESGMTKNISLFELLKVETADELDLNAYWTSSDIEKAWLYLSACGVRMILYI